MRSSKTVVSKLGAVGPLGSHSVICFGPKFQAGCRKLYRMKHRRKGTSQKAPNADATYVSESNARKDFGNPWSKMHTNGKYLSSTIQGMFVSCIQKKQEKRPLLSNFISRRLTL